MPALFIDLVLVIAGIVVLLFGGDFLVRGAVALARKGGIPPLLVGLTIVAFGTSAPEMVVSVAAAISGAPGLAVGNIVGSNIANVLLVLGLPALMIPMATTAPGVRRNAVIAFAASVLFVALTWDRVLDLRDGVILAVGIGVYLVYLAIAASRAQDDPVIQELTDVDAVGASVGGPAGIVVSLLVGVVALPAGAHLIVTGGAGLAAELGVPDSVIGLTVLALGTSLPELSTSMVAAFRRHADVAIGNVIGSNVFNVFAVGGITGVAAGLTQNGVAIDPEFFRVDYWVMLGAGAAIAAFVFLRRPISRGAGAVLFLGYCGYIGALAWINLS